MALISNLGRVTSLKEPGMAVPLLSYVLNKRHPSKISESLIIHVTQVGMRNPSYNKVENKDPLGPVE